MHGAEPYDAFLADESVAPNLERNVSQTVWFLILLTVLLKNVFLRFALGVSIFAMAVQDPWQSSHFCGVSEFQSFRTIRGPQPKRVHANSSSTSPRHLEKTSFTSCHIFKMTQWHNDIYWCHVDVMLTCWAPCRFGLMKFLKKRKLRKGTEHLSEAKAAISKSLEFWEVHHIAIYSLYIYSLYCLWDVDRCSLSLLFSMLVFTDQNLCFRSSICLVLERTYTRTRVRCSTYMLNACLWSALLKSCNA